MEGIKIYGEKLRNFIEYKGKELDSENIWRERMGEFCFRIEYWKKEGGENNLLGDVMVCSFNDVYCFRFFN